MDRSKVLHFLKAAQERGTPYVLVTVCAVEGSSMRNPGTIMGVAQDGSFEGSLSGGCIENAVVAEALDALKAGEPRVVRFGAGSPYLDIKLPCGGGLDLHFAPLGEGGLVSQCLASESAREPYAITVNPKRAEHRTRWPAIEDVRSFDTASGEGIFAQWPVPLIQIIGHGAAVEALSTLAVTMGCETRALTPDERIIKTLEEQGHKPILLKRRTQTDLLKSDPWTAFVFLFHDHDWEVDLMERALELPHFYLGAMGGRKAHAMRHRALSARGVALDEINEIRAPIGVFHSSRDPNTLALSTMAEIIRVYQDCPSHLLGSPDRA
ncbi:MAG: XdhC family protein [Pseudomonadota bacterium]